MPNRAYTGASNSRYVEWMTLWKGEDTVGPPIYSAVVVRKWLLLSFSACLLRYCSATDSCVHNVMVVLQPVEGTSSWGQFPPFLVYPDDRNLQLFDETFGRPTWVVYEGTSQYVETCS